jgi:hypothetical protein
VPETKIFSCVRPWGGLDQGLQISAAAGLGIAAEEDMGGRLLAIVHLRVGEVEVEAMVEAEEEARRYRFWFET